MNSYDSDQAGKRWHFDIRGMLAYPSATPRSIASLCRARGKRRVPAGQILAGEGTSRDNLLAD